MPNVDKRRSYHGDSRGRSGGSMAVHPGPVGTADGDAGSNPQDGSGARQAHGRDHNREQQADRGAGIILRGPGGSGEGGSLTGYEGNAIPSDGLAAGILRDGPRDGSLCRAAGEVREQQVESFELHHALKRVMAEIRRGLDEWDHLIDRDGTNG